MTNPLHHRPRLPEHVNLKYDDRESERLLTSPGLLSRFEHELRTGMLHPDIAAHHIAELRQFERAEKGERARPSEYRARPEEETLAERHGFPEPFRQKETHRPDREPGTRQHSIMSRAVTQMEGANLSRALRAQMDDHSSDTSTWARSDPNYREPSPAHDLSSSPPSLRESVEAAVTALDTPNLI